MNVWNPCFLNYKIILFDYWHLSKIAAYSLIEAPDVTVEFNACIFTVEE
jgi:hypothetical protein